MESGPFRIGKWQAAGWRSIRVEIGLGCCVGFMLLLLKGAMLYDVCYDLMNSMCCAYGDVN